MKKVLLVAVLIVVTLSACGGHTTLLSPTSAPTWTPLPFSFVSELPQGEFLFVHVYGDDYTCVDGFCACPVLETPAKPFEFREGKLRLNQYFFEVVPTDWLNLRKNSKIIALYSNWSPWNAQLQTFSSFPIATPLGIFSILGANPQGDIQITINNEYIIIPTGSYYTYTDEQLEEKSADCKVFNKYTLNNYGFIKDEDVEFTGGGCCEP